MVLKCELLQESSSTHDYDHDHDHMYDVFLSFRGADTRKGFTNNLHIALVESDITTFLDDTEIQTGQELKPELESAIKSSRASIIVLSKNYAFSTWCLDELVLILEQNKNFNQIVIPIFYHVEPTDVWRQQSSFGEAVAKHERRMEEETDADKKSQLAQKIELWKRALTQVVDLQGKEAKGNSWLTDGSTDILTVVGIGKKSVVKYVFQRSSFNIEASNRKQLFDSHKQLLNCKKALLVVDNVDCLDQLDALHTGNKSIITTKARKKDVVKPYDVLLCFKTYDIRNNLVSHLYDALWRAGIHTFLDDHMIDMGIPHPESEHAIKSSRASIIVLCRDYAFSRWCLDELVLILEHKRDSNHLIIPVFYDVEPTNVRKQNNSFGEAMAMHTRMLEKTIKEETDAMKRSQLAQKLELWKSALKQVADLKGKDANNMHLVDLIDEIVTEIQLRVCDTFTPLVGMHRYIMFIDSWLGDGSIHAADILTIAGVDGVGKTSLVQSDFFSNRKQFKRSSFIEGISKRCSEQLNGLFDLQKQLYEDISDGVSLEGLDASVYASKIEKALAREKVLLVLDDVDCVYQLDALLGNKGLHPGSKIIITTKDVSLIERCALFNSQVQPMHTKVLLNGLSESESLELLCTHAFKRSDPKEDYKEVLEKIMKYCEGLPLALKVLGGSLHKRDVAYWEECIRMLNKETKFDVKNVVRMSFDTLPSKNAKELFKHIACFFVGKDRDLTETILKACNIKTGYRIGNLIDRNLLSIGQNNELMMNRLVQEMGRDLVRQESP
ncbi:disease resistance protein RUN1-like [Bidens hawaiensis]|uniref:disease resistance protein RUN1-like n=1 Tax=Bidens hawaiensis TaxID=980011 RepID=UPI00404B96DB